MLFKNVCEDLKIVIDYNFDVEITEWLEKKINYIIDNKSVKDLYLTYSLIASKINIDKKLSIPNLEKSSLFLYLENNNATFLQIGRIYILAKVLELGNHFFVSKVSNIIQISDTTELQTFLKYLILLPNPENYKFVAVDALRTNITPVFEAISLNNPYPALYFDDKQWNQMYLKAAFMQRDLSMIVDIDKRANKDLARIISDYVHERWAASREIDPYFWRPVGKFLNVRLLEDMKKLFQSSNENEKMAAALCCSISEVNEAKELLNSYPLIKKQVDQNLISWKTLN